MAKIRASKHKCGTHYWHWCPGCKSLHMIDVRDDGQHPSWTFNGDMDKPTFNPPVNYYQVVCHYFVKDGHIAYCADSTHDLAGKTVPMKDLEDGEGA